MPNKKEIKLLEYLNKSKIRYDNDKRGDTLENIKSKLEITDEDFGDMHYSNFLDFGKNIVMITHEGSSFIENYCYSLTKEWFVWISGFITVVASIVAAFFSILAYYCN